MDRETAKTLSLVALIFVIISMISMIFYLCIYALLFAIQGAVMFDSDPTVGSATLCCFILIFLGLLTLPAINTYFAYAKIYVPIRDGKFTEDVKKFVIAALVLSFLGGGGWIPAIMYIIILASWNEISDPRRAYGMYPAYPPYPPYPMYGPPPGQYPPYYGRGPPGATAPKQMGRPQYRR